MKYGFISAGGGEWFSRTLKNLPLGARVFASIPKCGYVGVGTVIGEALNELALPLIRRQIPEIVDLWLPPAACSYRVAVVSIAKRYPGQAQRVMMALWGLLPQFSYTKTIVVVDDPVSSLDEQLMTGVQSMLVTQLDPLSPQPGCRQLFVLTHNAAFLRMWKKELDRGRGNRKTSQPPSASLHMMKSIRQGPTSEPGSRRPELVRVNLQSKSVSALDTEYHLLFYRVAHDLLDAKCSVQGEGDLRLVAESSNSARKLLEHFLAFTHPNQAGKFTNVVDHSLPGQQVRARRINALLNSNSHRSPDPEGKEPLSDEAQGTITDVFRLINEVNPGHFEGMCSRLGMSEHKGSLLRD
jgi:hypothetical protein